MPPLYMLVDHEMVDISQCRVSSLDGLDGRTFLASQLLAWFCGTYRWQERDYISGPDGPTAWELRHQPADPQPCSTNLFSRPRLALPILLLFFSSRHHLPYRQDPFYPKRSDHLSSAQSEPRSLFSLAVPADLFVYRVAVR
jgi:hypothetical protein